MSTSRNVVISAVIAAVIAVTLVTATVLSPGLLSSKSTSPGTTSSIQQTGIGTLAVMLTDPPTVPSGVTALYATYNNLAVHVSDAGNQSGWYDLHASGTINLMGVINVSQTIASSSVPSGVYNAVRFNITSAEVTYNGKNQTALMVENQQGTRILTVPIVGGVQVTSQDTSAAVLDLTPTVLLLGNTSDPTFAFIGAATAYSIPTNSMPRGFMVVGAKTDLRGLASFIDHFGHFQITSVSLSPNSLSISVTNNGNASLVFRLAAVSATTSDHGGFVPIWADSAAFVVLPNQTLVSMNSGTKFHLIQQVAAGGFLVAPHTSATFTYNGEIMIGPVFVPISPNAANQQPGTMAQTFMSMHAQPQPVVSGQKYIVSIQGSGLFAQTEIAAS